jgi:hypothetical protein
MHLNALAVLAGRKNPEKACYKCAMRDTSPRRGAGEEAENKNGQTLFFGKNCGRIRGEWCHWWRDAGAGLVAEKIFENVCYKCGVGRECF